MEERTNVITIDHTDEKINAALTALHGTGRYSRHFTQTEEFFLKLERDYTIPSLPIHHDIGSMKPRDDYIAALRTLLDELILLAPDVFSGLDYFFDPQEIFRPCFYKLYRIGNDHFIYLLRLDISFKPRYQTIIARGNNDLSHTSRTSCLFLEALCVPLKHIDETAGRLRGFTIKSLFSETWIGEYGRGFYSKQGIWMDNDLSKFFTRLFVPSSLVLYPYYPLVCKYRTICGMLINFSEREREEKIPVLRDALLMLSPSLSEIQGALKDSGFSDTLAVFTRLKALVDPSMTKVWENLAVSVYLNADDVKEFLVEDRR